MGRLEATIRRAMIPILLQNGVAAQGIPRAGVRVYVIIVVVA